MGANNFEQMEDYGVDYFAYLFELLSI